MRGGENVRPVEPPELDQTELDIAGLVLVERLAQPGHAGLDVVSRGVLQRRDVDGAHGDAEKRAVVAGEKKEPRTSTSSGR